MSSEVTKRFKRAVLIRRKMSVVYQQKTPYLYNNIIETQNYK